MREIKGEEMRRGKLKVVMIVLVVMIVFLVAAIGVLAYVRTHNKKQQFFTYFAQNMEIVDILKEEELAQYFKQEQEKPFENTGEIHIQTNGTEQDALVKDFSVTFSGKKNEKEKYKEQDIVLAYGNDVTIPLQYKQADNVYAIKSEYIGQNYIGIKDDGVMLENYDLESIQKIDAQSEWKKAFLTIQEIPMDTIEKIVKDYGAILINTLDDACFSKTEKGYTLQITENQCKTVIKEIVARLKQDEMAKQAWLTKYPEKTEKDWEEVVETATSRMEKDFTDTVFLTIELTVEKEKLQTTVIQFYEVYQLRITRKGPTALEGEMHLDMDGVVSTFQFALEKQKAETLVYKGKIVGLRDGEEIARATATAEYAGLKERQNVTETYQVNTVLKEDFKKEYLNRTGLTSQKQGVDMLGAEEEAIEATYQFTTTKTFSEELPFIPLTNVNMLLVNDLQQEQQTTLLKAIIERWFYVSEMQMQQLGTQEAYNPVYTLYPNLKEMDAEDIRPKSNWESELNQNTAEAYNGRLKNYQGEQSGSTVKMLLDTIKLDNQMAQSPSDIVIKDENAIIKTITLEADTYEATTENITNVKKQIAVGKKYTITFSYGEGTEYIQHVKIQEKVMQ